MIEIMPIGGYDEFGKNMTAVKVGDDVVILDMGLHVEKYISFGGDEERLSAPKSTLISQGIIPDDTLISLWKNKVRAIVVSHGHLDHIGAIPFLSNSYDAPIICTEYTAEIIKMLARDDGHEIKNKFIVLDSNSTYDLKKNFKKTGKKTIINNSSKIQYNAGIDKIEFIHVTHSIPHTVMIAIHSSDGVILYSNDFKFDNYPVLGKKPNYQKLKHLGLSGVSVLIADGTGAGENQKTPSETVARDMLKDLLTSETLKSRNIFVTTFSSHIERLKSIVDFAEKIKRKPVFLGRSMHKYITAAENIKLVNFSKKSIMIRFRTDIKKFLRKVERSGKQDRYLFICTGHQGEEKAVLGRIAYNEINYDLSDEDSVIFSCRVIPTETNKKNREKLDKTLKSYKVRLFTDVHVSGHASREDHRYLIELLRPKHIIPAHGEKKMTDELVRLSEELGYKRHRTVHHVKNGELLKINDI